jgi:5-(carboxyamino)imidazole ribonucleotide mutase
MKKVGVVLGSDSDMPVAEKAFAVLKALEIPWTGHIISAHRTPDAAAEFAKNARRRGYGVLIAFAGMAAHLAGSLASQTTLPVIGVPCSGGILDGLDALLATVQMPSGVPVAALSVNGGANAAYLAAEILAVSDDGLAKKLVDLRVSMAEAVSAKNTALFPHSREPSA